MKLGVTNTPKYEIVLSMFNFKKIFARNYRRKRPKRKK
jgi:hypothetical protein